MPCVQQCATHACAPSAGEDRIPEGAGPVMEAMQYAAASVVRANPDLGHVLQWYETMLGCMMSIEEVAPGTLDFYTSVFLERLAAHPGLPQLAEKTAETVARLGHQRGAPAWARTVGGNTATTGASSREDEADAAFRCGKCAGRSPRAGPGLAGTVNFPASACAQLSEGRGGVAAQAGRAGQALAGEVGGDRAGVACAGERRGFPGGGVTQQPSLNQAPPGRCDASWARQTRTRR